MIKNNTYNLSLLYWGILVIALIPLFAWDKGTVVIWLNDHRTKFGDTFFKMITHLGTSYILIPFVLYYLWKDKQKIYGLVLAWIFHAVIVTGMKQLVYITAQRPIYFLKGQHNFNLIEDISYPVLNSFPSGHTTTAFVGIISLLLIYKKSFLVPIGFTIAILVGISRMYLLQHFFVDVYTGMIIGGLSAFAGYSIAIRRGWL